MTKAVPPSPTGLKILTLVAKDVGSASSLADQLEVTLPRISAVALELRKAELLKKVGRKYALTRRGIALLKELSKESTKPIAAAPLSLTPNPTSAIASQSALTKDLEAKEAIPSRAGSTLKNSQIPNVSNLGLNEIETSSFRIASDGKPKLEIQGEALFFIARDWHDFMHLATLSRKAGCAPEDLARVIYKEATDNACDSGANVSLSLWTDSKGNRGICLKDDGPGLDPEEVRQIYSVNRPQMSSKRIRRVSRGLLGNGARVIGGAVAATQGTLMVETRGHKLVLQMDPNSGQMVIQSDELIAFKPGLTLYLALGPALAFKENDLDLAQATIRLRPYGYVYSGPSSPHWYGSHHLFRLAQEAPAQMNFSALCRACGFVIAGITQPFWRRPAKELSETEIQSALEALCARNKQIAPPRLGLIGPQAFAGSAYAKELGVCFLDGGQLPYVLEAFGKCDKPPGKTSGELNIDLFINRSMTPTKLYGVSTPERFTIHGCDLQHRALKPPKTGNYTITLSIITPRLPLVSDGKEPSLKHLLDPIMAVVCKAARKAYGALERPDRTRIKEAAWQVMEKAYLLASGNGKYPALARQVMYGARPDILQITGLSKFNDKYFTQTLLPDYLRAHPAQTGNWNIAFDPRGHGTEPHTGYRVEIGTLAVHAYLERIRQGISLAEVIGLPPLGLYPTVGPLHRFKDVLFVEKEGFEPLFASARIAERYDIFIVSTKGMSVTALRQLVDELSQHGVKRIFVLHDFDKSGFSIRGTLGLSGRRYQFKNQVDIIDIGLRLTDIDEIERLEGYRLQSEPIDLPANPQKRARKLASQAKTLQRHGATPEEIEFLSEERTELNMMYAPTFIALLERKFADYNVAKLIPDLETLQTHALRYRQWELAKELLDRHRDELKAKAAAIPTLQDLDLRIAALLVDQPELAWDQATINILSQMTDNPIQQSQAHVQKQNPERPNH